MTGEESKKRQRPDGYRRKHDRNKFRKTTNATVHRKDLGNALRGFLISCTPHHENKCYRDAVLLLGKYCESKSADAAGQNLEDELANIRSESNKVFTRVDGGVKASVFLQISDANIDIEKVVEAALREARATGNAGSRHCIRLLPIHLTCYAKADDAAKASVKVVEQYFPKVVDKDVSYAIVFRSRLNNGAKRDIFIPTIASAIEQLEPRYTVNLTTPDVVLLVEVLKTSCCIGVFKHYYELAKMNLREAACPSPPKDSKEPKKSETDKQGETGNMNAEGAQPNEKPTAAKQNSESGDPNDMKIQAEKEVEVESSKVEKGDPTSGIEKDSKQELSKENGEDSRVDVKDSGDATTSEALPAKDDEKVERSNGEKNCTPAVTIQAQPKDEAAANAENKQ